MDFIYWLALGVFLFAGTIKGAIGLGLPTTVISLLSQVTDPRVAVALGILPMILSNAWQFYREGRMAETIRRYWPFAAVMAATLFLTSLLVVGVDAESILLATGGAIALFAAVSLYRHPPFLPDRWQTHGQVAAGGLSGVMGGLTGLWSPPMIVFLLSRRLDKSAYVRTFGFLLVMGATPLLAGYAANGLMTRELFLMSCLMCAPTFLGFAIGERIRRRMDTARYQKAVLVFFLLMGLNLIRKAWMG